MSANKPYAEALYHALRDDPFYRTLESRYPARDGARGAMLFYYDISIREGIEWGRVCMPDSGQYGISVWSLPLPEPVAAQKAAAKHAALEQAMGPECLEVFMDIEASMAEQEAGLKLERHWYLSILGIDPSRQGQGLGGGLVTPVLREADALGVASYLTTFTPRNIPFYERLGYRAVGDFPECVTNSRFCVLVRDPQDPHPAISGG
jgi:GNAT superfamily N-acetyltransferase